MWVPCDRIHLQWLSLPFNNLSLINRRRNCKKCWKGKGLRLPLVHSRNRLTNAITSWNQDSAKNQSDCRIRYRALFSSGKKIINNPLWTTRRVPQETFLKKPYNKSFIVEACSVKMAGYWPRSFFFCVFMDLDSVSVHKHAKKKRTRPICSHLDLTLGQ